MSTPTSSPARRAASLAEKTILGFIAGGAAAIGILEIVFLVIRIAALLGDDRVTLTGVHLAEPLEPGFASPAVVSATAGTATIVVEGLPLGDRAYLVAAALLGSLLVLGICGVLAWLCVRVFLGRPFVGSATWGIGIVAILVIAAGFGVPTLTALANAEAALALGLGEIAPFLVEIDLAPIGWGIALAVVAGAFEIGQRLQRDTTGLV